MHFLILNKRGSLDMPEKIVNHSEIVHPYTRRKRLALCPSQEQHQKGRKSYILNKKHTVQRKQNVFSKKVPKVIFLKKKYYDLAQQGIFKNLLSHLQG